MFYVYLMHCEAFSDQSYLGFTADLKSRMTRTALAALPIRLKGGR